MRQLLTSLPRSSKRALLFGFDLFAIGLSLAGAFFVGVGAEAFGAEFGAMVPVFILVPLATVPYLIHSGLYNAVTRYTGREILEQILRAVTLGLATFMVILFFLQPNAPLVPRSVPFAYWAAAILTMTATRYGVGAWLYGNSLGAVFAELLGLHQQGQRRGLPVAIYGAGTAGRQLALVLQRGHVYQPRAFIDDDPELQHTTIVGLPVYPPRLIPKMMAASGVKEILLAMPSVSRQRRKQIIELLEPYQLHVKTMPGPDELARGVLGIEGLRDVDVADILGRDVVPPLPELFAPCIRGKAVLVTGAGGSIGAELCRQLVTAAPARLVLFENSEYNLYTVADEMLKLVAQAVPTIEVIPLLGSVTEPWQLLDVIKKFHIQTLYHAAAYKHVPIVEYNSHHGFRNNVLGTLHAAQAAILHQVENFVLISTDKAVRPTNMMGATKRLAELVLQAFSRESAVVFWEPEHYGLTPDAHVINRTRFTLLRFGNVLDSSGSVVPRFRQQIRNGGPITVTHPDIIRYFMTIPEAAQLVIQAASLSKGGDVFVLDMGDPVKIDHLARQLIKLSGLTVKDAEHPDGDIAIEYTGLRPGEKLFEELLIGGQVYTTRHPKIRRANELVLPWPRLRTLLDDLVEAFARRDYDAVRALLITEEAVGYTPTGEISDWLAESIEGHATMEVRGERL